MMTFGSLICPWTQPPPIPALKMIAGMPVKNKEEEKKKKKNYFQVPETSSMF